MRLRWMWIAVLTILSLMAAACSGDSAELDEVTAERDALATQLATLESRHELAQTNQTLVADIIADPDAFGDRDEVLNALSATADPRAIMDDTAFGPVPIRAAWDNTIYGSDATLKTWVTWLAEDGSGGGSLWTWTGTADNGKPFELIGVNIDRYDETGLMNASLIDWPYPAETVRAIFATGDEG